MRPFLDRFGTVGAVVAAITTALLFAGYHMVPSSILLQVSLAGLVVASIWLAVELRRRAKCVNSAAADA